MHDRHGHLDDHAFFQKVSVVEQSVFANEAGAGAVSVNAEHFLERGVQEMALIAHTEDAKGLLGVWWCCRNSGGLQFGANVHEECGVGVDVDEHVES